MYCKRQSHEAFSSAPWPKSEQPTTDAFVIVMLNLPQHGLSTPPPAGRPAHTYLLRRRNSVLRYDLVATLLEGYEGHKTCVER